MSRKPRKAKDPQQSALVRRMQDFEAVSLPPASAALKANEDVQVTRQGEKRDGQSVAENRARRLDAFEALRDGMRHLTGAYDAARRLERDMHIRMGETGRFAPERLDSKPQHDRLASMIAAGEAVDDVLALIGQRDAWLLVELIRPSQVRNSWRDTVAYVTGETNTHAQAAAVRSACVNLRDAYERQPRKAA